ncbi:MAG: hypothetical protein DRI74_02235 [Bacteroidetes bacterium]|nr:MAG: hypothetical protein DRI74_02235 [Bacteroidota bacterium]
MKLNKLYYFVLFIGLGISLFSCTKDDTDTPDNPQAVQRGDLIKSVKMDDITITEINLGLTLTGAHTILNPEYKVEMIKLSYSTIDSEGEPTTASGALFIPVTGGTFPMLSYQHGTLAKRTNVPTYMGSNSTEGMVGALSASLGFISCLPDYLGLGDSHEVHPYLQSELSASASIDMLIAAKNYCDENGISYSDDLYICGYSEGGYVTMATQKKIEASYSSQFQLKASAPMAGPYDVEATADGILALDTYNSPALIGFILYSYAEYYDNLNLSDIFNAPYADLVSSLYDGTNDLGTINANLTTDMTALLNQTFVNGFKTNDNHVLRLDFRENSLLDWNPKNPIRFYHSLADEIVPYAISVNAEQILSANSSSTVELISIQTGSHTDAAVPIILSALEWFDSLK